MGVLTIVIPGGSGNIHGSLQTTTETAASQQLSIVSGIKKLKKPTQLEQECVSSDHHCGNHGSLQTTETAVSQQLSIVSGDHRLKNS